MGACPRRNKKLAAAEFWPQARAHAARPGGFAAIAAYLCITWCGGLLPSCYYSSEGNVRWRSVALQLLVQDLGQFVMHRAEHRAPAWWYRLSHKPHHRITSPRLFDAFDGTTGDTCLMVLLPLYVTALTVHANAWSYMAFGALYSSWLTLIHSEFDHPWDPAFRWLGLGTPADHAVHHRLSVYNYGHLTTFWDRACGTYRRPPPTSDACDHGSRGPSVSVAV